MVGGDVSIVTPDGDGTIEVQVVGNKRCERYERLAVKVKDTPTARQIRPGDKFWWQSSWVFWTPRANVGKPNPRGGVDYDIRLERASSSYEPKAEKGKQ